MKTSYTYNGRALALLCAVGLAGISALIANRNMPVRGSNAQSDPRPIESSTARLTSEQAREAYGQIEMGFEANQGQTESAVNFLARGAGYSLFLKPTEAVFVLARHEGRGKTQITTEQSSVEQTKQTRSSQRDDVSGSTPQGPPKVFRMKLVGADESAAVEGLNELEGKVNYFIGKDQAQWRTNVSTFGRVHYREAYPGIDIVYYGNQRQLEYDFVVAPGRDARSIKLRFDGTDKVEVDAAGDLLLTLGDSVIRQPKPIVYQEVAGSRREVEGGYAVGARGQVAFTVGEYDRSVPLVIDPTLVYSTYLGGSGNDSARDIAVDSAGSVYICGETNSTNFPTANAFDATFNTGNIAADRDAFVAKINPAGTALVYSTYLGGTGNSINLSGDDLSTGIAVDSVGNAYVAGETRSTDFPTANAIQGTFNGGLFEGFLTKLNASGSALVYSTYIGGDTFDSAASVAVDSSGNAYVAGRTTSSNFATVNPIQATFAGGGSDAFVMKLNAAGSAIVYSTYLGGGGGNGFDAAFSIAIDSSRNAYITGPTLSTDFPTANAIQATFGGGTNGDAYVAKLNAAGSALVYSTYLGGSDSDTSQDIAVDASGNAHVTGSTSSTNFPIANAFDSTLAGTSDAFITKVNAAGSAFVYSTYLGGSGFDAGNDIVVDSSGSTYVAGTIDSTNFPTVNPIQATYGGGTADAFVTKFNAAGSALLFSTYLGGSASDRGNAIAVDSAGSMYVAGATASTNFPTLNPVQAANAGGDDAFVTKISDPPPPPPTPSPSPTCPQTLNYTVSPTSVVLSGDAFEISGRSSGSVTLTTAAPVDGVFAGSITLIPGRSMTPVGDYSAMISQTITFQGGQSATLSRRLVYTVTASERRPSYDTGETKTVDLGTLGKVDITLKTVVGVYNLPNNTTAFLTYPAVNDATFQLHDIPGGSPCATPSPSPSPSPALPTVQFSQARHSIVEACTSLPITITRTGDLSGTTTVDYRTNDGTATKRMDFNFAAGRVFFAPSEASKTIPLLISEDSRIEGTEQLTISLSNPIGASLGTPATTTIEILDDNTEPTTNVIDDPATFVCQQYHDFLNRDPEPDGQQYYLNIINNYLNTSPCTPADTDCVKVIRGIVSANFLRSPEFQRKGNYVMFLYMVSLGQRAITSSELSDPSKIERPLYEEFMTDLITISDPNDDAAKQEAKKVAFTDAWMLRPEIQVLYPASMSNEAFVQKLLDTAGVTNSQQSQLVSDLNASVKTRAQVLRIIAESSEVNAKFYKPAFVTMEYVGYLHREPEDCHNSSNWTGGVSSNCGYIFHNNRFNLPFAPAEVENIMARGFIESPEYRQRFGP